MVGQVDHDDQHREPNGGRDEDLDPLEEHVGVERANGHAPASGRKLRAERRFGRRPPSDLVEGSFLDGRHDARSAGTGPG